MTRLSDFLAMVNAVADTAADDMASEARAIRAVDWLADQNARNGKNYGRCDGRDCATPAVLAMECSMCGKTVKVCRAHTPVWFDHVAECKGGRNDG